MSETQSTSSDDAQTGGQTADAPSNVGALLREHREKAGLDVADVARVLRISQKYLEALEDGRSEDLPGTPYAIGFVRSYAEHLHLDGEEIVRRYKEEVEGLSGKTDLVFPKPIPDGGVPGTAVLALGVIVAAVAYGAWYWQSSQDSVDVARVEPVPEHMAAETMDTPDAATPAPVQDGAEVSVDQPNIAERTEEIVEEAEEMAEAAVESVAETVTDAEEAPAEAAETVVAEAEEAAESAAQSVASGAEESAEAAQEDMAGAEAEATPTMDEAEAAVRAADEAVEEVATEPETEASAESAATQAASENLEPMDVATVTEAAEPAAVEDEPMEGDSRVRLRAKEDNWILVRDTADDRLLFGRVLPKGEHYDVPNRPNLILMTGNAGALEVVVDGDVVPALGGMGEVRRDVALDPESLKSGSAASN